MAKYVKFDDAYEMLSSIGGCGAKPESWASGWDRAIDTAIAKLENIPVTDEVSSNKFDLKPCPFCGTTERVYSNIRECGIRQIIEIGCKECEYYLTTDYIPKGDHLSLKEMSKLMEHATEKWNTRSDKI